jgi:uncharacterized protein YjiK
LRRGLVLRTLAAALALCACARPSAQAEPASSAFAAAPDLQWRLPDRLREISGLAVSPDGRLFAHDDEAAVIYELDVARRTIVKAFALGDPVERGDFEGLAITPSGDFWLTTSRGRLYRFREADDGAHAAYDRFDAGLDDICEIEGLAYLEAEESLILACKRHHARGMRDTVGLYAWPVGGSAAVAWRSWREAELTRAAGVRAFRPSSLDIDPASGRIILLSANDNALAEFSADGALLAARALGTAHTQAEGAAIAPDGALMIADEGHAAPALLSRYARVP